MAGQNLADLPEKRPRRGGVIQTEKIGQRRDIDVPLDGRMGQEGFDFRPEQERVRQAGVEEGLDAEPVPDQPEPPETIVPQAESKNAVEFPQALRAPFLIGMDDDFGVRLGTKDMPPLPQFAADFPVVVDRGVGGDPHGPVFIAQGLPPGFFAGGGRPPPVAQADGAGDPDSFPVRPAVDQRPDHPFENRRRRLRPVQMEEAGDSAHLLQLLQPHL